MDHEHHGTKLGKRRTVLNKLRNYFLTGVIVAAPLTITVYLTASIVNWVDGLVKPWIPRAWNPENYVPFPLPGTGLVVALAALTLLGFLAATFFGRATVALGESILARMPLVRTLYGALKQIFETMLSERSSTFRQAGLIEYPRRGLWAVVFIATDTRGELHHRLAGGSEDTISVFLPTTPNPTSGFLLFVPKRDVLVLDMSVEEAAKLVISAGLITPDWPPKEGRRRGLPPRQAARGQTAAPTPAAPGSAAGDEETPSAASGGVPQPGSSSPPPAPSPPEPGRAASREEPGRAASPREPERAASPQEPERAPSPQEPGRAPSPQEPGRASSREEPARASALQEPARASAEGEGPPTLTVPVRGTLDDTLQEAGDASSRRGGQA